MKGTNIPVRETPPGHYVCTRCGRAIKSNRAHVMCRDCRTVEDDLAHPERIAALDQKLDPQPKPAPTHCPHGHEYTPENTMIDKRGWINCRTCRHEYDRVSRVRRKAQKAVEKGAAA